MAVSVLQAGPMVQMIFARRGEALAASSGDERAVSGDCSALLFFRLAFKFSSIEAVADVSAIVET
jgi:hypothetical protein